MKNRMYCIIFCSFAVTMPLHICATNFLADQIKIRYLCSKILNKTITTDKAIQFIEKHNINVNTKDFFGYDAPLLAIAVDAENIDFLQYLLNKGAFVDASSLYGITAFLWALMKKNFTMADLLLQYGAHIDYTDNKNIPLPLYFAMEKLDSDVVRYLLKKGAEARALYKGHPILCYAFSTGNINFIKPIIEYGGYKATFCFSWIDRLKQHRPTACRYMKYVGQYVGFKEITLDNNPSSIKPDFLALALMQEDIHTMRNLLLCKRNIQEPLDTYFLRAYKLGKINSLRELVFFTIVNEFQIPEYLQKKTVILQMLMQICLLKQYMRAQLTDTYFNFL